MRLWSTDLGKRYNQQWIFRHLNLSCEVGEVIGIVGGNGSGKSTLLKCLMGFERTSEGELGFDHKGTLKPEQLFTVSSVCAPYQSLYEELTLEECFDLHRSFKPMRVQHYKDFRELIQLSQIDKKPLRQFSSGMRQRVKLALAFLTESPLLFIDEPTSNLDRQAIQWFADLFQAQQSNRIVFVASNHNADELIGVTQTIDVQQLK
ncbi:MAG TPA: ABC transporter ATP-binding protein [Luteibaculaceae bacterium]|jgi:ABC-type multidrug transport system ATPase subunit|nr:ABC transporter ATP-binding protein [Luteibaculaceae bacterium]